MEDCVITASDGYRLAATLFRPAGAARARVIVNSAMAVPRHFYAAFAAAAAERGFAVATYDYRGIGCSRPARLRGFAARASDWMTLDFEAILAWTRGTIGAARTFVVGHSFGGNAFGLAPSAASVDGGLFVASQSGYWKHWAAARSEHLHVSPREHGIAKVGHFGFFRHPPLWPLALDWLRARVETMQ